MDEEDVGGGFHGGGGAGGEEPGQEEEGAREEDAEEEGEAGEKDGGVQEEQEQGQGEGQSREVRGGWQEGGEYVGEGGGKRPAQAGHSPRPPHWQTVAARGHAMLHTTRESSQLFHHNLCHAAKNILIFFILSPLEIVLANSIETFPPGCVHMSESN